jgi:hypothetical protein
VVQNKEVSTTTGDTIIKTFLFIIHTAILALVINACVFAQAQPSAGAATSMGGRGTSGTAAGSRQRPDKAARLASITEIEKQIEALKNLIHKAPSTDPCIANLAGNDLTTFQTQYLEESDVINQIVTALNNIRTDRSLGNPAINTLKELITLAKEDNALKLITHLEELTGQADARGNQTVENRIATFAENDKQQAPPVNGIVFVGSSIFDQWTNVTEQMKPMPVFNRAIGGTKTYQQLQYIEQLTIKYNPRIIVYYCGSNDVDEGSTVEAIVDYFKQYVDIVAKKLPQTRILYVSINRAPEKRAKWDIVDAANDKIKAYAAESKVVNYVDVNPTLFDEKGEPRLELYRNDLLHFNPPAYDEFTKIIKPVLQKLWDDVSQ